MVDEKLIISIKHYKDMQEYARLGENTLGPKMIGTLGFSVFRLLA